MSDDASERARKFVDTIVPRLMDQGKIPGLSISIVRDGEVLYAEGFGARSVEGNLPATPNTLYGIGSCTKSFVALAIMQLVEKGKISLDDPVSRYIPLKIGTPDRPITVHHLLTHSSGIPSLGTSTIALHRGMGIDVWVPWGGVNDFYRHVNGAGEEIAADPGERFFYLNAGYRMLGHILQEASGRRFDLYITENILRPLKMSRATLSKAEFMRDPDRMTPHRRDRDGKLIPTDYPYPNVGDNPDFAFIAAAGGMMAPVSELANYLKANINMGVFDGVELLSPELMMEMQRIHMDRPPDHFGRYGYGYGWNVTEDFLGTRMVSHGGSILVSTAHLAFIPGERIGVAMASNAAGFPYAMVAQGIFAALMGKVPEEAVPALRIRRKMEMLAGAYEIYRGLSRVEVVNRGGLLYLEQKGAISETTVPLIPEDMGLDTDKFYTWSEGVKQPVEFVVYSPEKIDLYVERNRYHKI